MTVKKCFVVFEKPIRFTLDYSMLQNKYSVGYGFQCTRALSYLQNVKRNMMTIHYFWQIK